MIGYYLTRRQLQSAYVALAALALSACATPQPIVTRCATVTQYEQLKAAEPPKVHDQLTRHADEDVRPLAGSALELRAWGHALLDTLRICAGPVNNDNNPRKTSPNDSAARISNNTH